MTGSVLHLQAVEARDFAQHVDLALDLAGQMTVIRGSIGSGKSTALKAVPFAFFGLTAVPGGKDVAVRTGQKDCFVKVNFTLGDTAYSVERTTKNATLYKEIGERERIANGTSAVNDWMKDHLGLDAKMFTNLVYSEQGKTDTLLTLGAPALNSLVEKLSGADFVDRIIKRALKRQTHVDGQLSAIPVPIETEEIRNESDTGRKRLEQLQAEYTAAESAAAELARQLDAVDTRLKSAGDHNRNARCYLASKKRCDDTIVANRASRDTLAGSLLSLPEISPWNSSHADAAKNAAVQCDNRRALRREAHGDNVAAWASVERIGEKIDTCSDIAAKASELGAALAHAVEVNNAINAGYLGTVADARTAAQAVANAKNALTSSICKGCKRPLDNSHIADLEVELEAALVVAENADNEAAESAVLLGQSQAEVKNLRHLHEDAVKASTLLEQYRAQLSEAEARIAKNTAVLSEISESIEDEYRAAAAHYADVSAKIKADTEVQARRADLAARIESAESALAKAQAELDGLEVIVEIDSSELIVEHRKSSEALHMKQSELHGLETEYNNLERKIEQLDKVIADNNGYRERRSALESRAKLLSALVKYLRDNKSRYLSDTWASLTATVSEFVRQTTDGVIELVSRTDDGDFVFAENGITRPIVCMSGGQRSLGGIGMQLALGMMRPAGAGLLILDEPSAQLNDDAAATLAGVLRAQDRQVILVTHRDGEEFSADRVYVFESKVTKE